MAGSSLANPASDDQLSFRFALHEPAPAAEADILECSRQELRRQVAGRNVRMPVLDRSLEELQLEHGLSTYLPPGKAIGLRLTENRYTIISVRRGRDLYRVRVHRMFASAEPRMVRALARYVVHNDQRASSLLGEYIERHQHMIRSEPRRTPRTVLRPVGRVHDLSAIYERLNRRYFEGKHDARITWGATKKPTQQRSIKVGSFSVEDRLIRVHSILDQEMVPSYFLEWIVFHEMLHGKHAILRVKGRRCFHPPEFSQEERQFPDYGRARLWEKANMDRLLGG
jgi:predicted metal-dependent hydrolase